MVPVALGNTRTYSTVLLFLSFRTDKTIIRKFLSFLRVRFGVLLYGTVLCLGMIWTLHNERSAIERDDRSDVQSLQKLPKAGYASKVAIAELPNGRARKTKL